MKRISTNMQSLDMRYHMRVQEWKMNQLQNKMASQKRITALRDDPIAASHSTRFQSALLRLKGYTKNVETLRGSIAVTEGYLNEAVDVLQRVREIAVRGAQGTLDASDMAILGDEVNHLLNELVTIGNARTHSGHSLFSGFKTGYEPFRVTRGLVSRDREEMIVSVDYVGDIGKNEVDISSHSTSVANIPGNHAFWAENQRIYANLDARDYRVQTNSTIRIDGMAIELHEGDNVHAIMSKINDSGAAVRAKLDPVGFSLILETTIPHQLWPEDVGDARVLQDLGIIREGDISPPLNIADTARVFGGSVFDMAMHLRDSLYQSDYTEIAGGGIRGVDDALNNLIHVRADIGAEDRRLEETFSRLTYEIPIFTNLNSQEVDIDITEAITNLKMLEYAHEAALATAGRVLRMSLLDYLG